MKSAVPVPPVLTLLLSQKSNRTLPTALVGQAQPVLPQIRLKRLRMEKLRRPFRGKLSQSHTDHLPQRQNCSLRCFETYLLGAAHRSLPDAEQQILLTKDFIFVFPFLVGGGILLPPCPRCFCLIFPLLLALFPLPVLL